MEKVQELTEKWLDWDKNEKTRKEVEKLKEAGDWSTLSNIMNKRLEFGTAGIRGRMGPGFGQMNDLVIIQVTQGLRNYLQTVDKDVCSKGVVLGYDGRHNSHRWAKLAAATFLRANIPVYLFTTTTPTPFTPFTINKLGLSAGVMVTASHNPKWDNGYKVYWGNGAQILSPHDKEIQQEILRSLHPETGAFQEVNSHPLLKDPMEAVYDDYFHVIQRSAYSLEMNSRLSVPLVYTAMHGVGNPYVHKAWTSAGFKAELLHSVAEQADPDPEFSTVDFPNPEEGASALDLSFKKANEIGARYIIANDPDADRLGVAQKTGDDWRILSGNEIGTLLGWWLLQDYKDKNPGGNLGCVYLLASTVSSKFLQAMATKEGAVFIETLTGFKHMGNEADKLINAGKKVIFAYEEAIGFMCGSAVLDKDGVSAAVRVGELVAYLEEKGESLISQIDNIYSMYGYHCSLNSYYLCYNQHTTNAIFNRIRNFQQNQPDTYPEQIGGVGVANVRDLTTGFDSSQPERKAVLPTSRSSHMITFWLDNGIVLTLRTSGTEPKIKYYTEFCAKPGLPSSDWPAVREELTGVVQLAVEQLLQPQINQLKPKSD